MSANEIKNFKHELATRPKRAEILDLLAKKTSFWDLKQSLDAALEQNAKKQHLSNAAAIVSGSPCFHAPLLNLYQSSIFCSASHLLINPRSANNSVSSPVRGPCYLGEHTTSTEGR